MKFELTEIVAVSNPDEVLRVLEQHLRSVAGDVVRSERQVTAFGIGPSPRTVNRRDTTVIEGLAVDGTTVLQVRVTYQASALLGNVPQDDIVRSKIEGAIDETRGELKVWKAWETAPESEDVSANTAAATENLDHPRSSQQPRAFDKQSTRWSKVAELEVSAPPPESAQPFEIPRTSSPITALASEQAEGRHQTGKSWPGPAIEPSAESAQESVASEPAEATEATAEYAQPTAERSVILTSKIGRRRAKRQATLQSETEPDSADGGPATIFRNEATTATGAVQVPLAELVRGGGREDAEGMETSAPRRWTSVLAALLVLIVAAGGTGYIFRDELPVQEDWKAVAAGWSATLQSDLSDWKGRISGKKLDTQSSEPAVPSVAPLADEPDQLTVSDPEVMVKPESNIYLWVQDWAAAQRSKDPVAQASYYADTVDRYLAESGVSRNAVLKAKKDAIGKRSGLWSVKVEHVFIESQSSTGMSVRAIKRTMSRSESGKVSEQRMKVRLKVVRADGTWKIVEEQELGPPAPSA